MHQPPMRKLGHTRSVSQAGDYPEARKWQQVSYGAYRTVCSGIIWSGLSLLAYSHGFLARYSRLSVASQRIKLGREAA